MKEITSGGTTPKRRIYSMSVASVYPHYLAKAEKMGRTDQRPFFPPV